MIYPDWLKINLQESNAFPIQCAGLQSDLSDYDLWIKPYYILYNAYTHTHTCTHIIYVYMYTHTYYIHVYLSLSLIYIYIYHMYVLIYSYILYALSCPYLSTTHITSVSSKVKLDWCWVW